MMQAKSTISPPDHCRAVIVSAGKSKKALIVATSASDIIKIAARPGKRMRQAQKIASTLGKSSRLEQMKARGKAATIWAAFGPMSSLQKAMAFDGA